MKGDYILLVEIDGAFQKAEASLRTYRKRQEGLINELAAAAGVVGVQHLLLAYCQTGICNLATIERIAFQVSGCAEITICFIAARTPIVFSSSSDFGKNILSKAQ